MNRTDVEARFIEGERGRLFIVVRAPTQGCSDSVLIIPPFAEEMNKSRHLLTDVARRGAARGYCVVLPDFFGTGDSDGEFRDADLNTWQADLGRVADWCVAVGRPIRTIIAVRFGAYQAIQFLRAHPAGIERLVFWQPVVDGRRVLTQFLRLRVAASMMTSGGGESVEGLRARLAGGEQLEVAGYELSPALAQQLDGSKSVGATGIAARAVDWFEIVRNGGDPPPATLSAVAQLRGVADSVSLHVLRGEPFWSATETVRLPELGAKTIDVLH